MTTTVCTLCNQQYLGHISDHTSKVCPQKLVAVGPGPNLPAVYLKRINGLYTCPFNACQFARSATSAIKQHITRIHERSCDKPQDGIATEVKKNCLELAETVSHTIFPSLRALLLHEHDYLHTPATSSLLCAHCPLHFPDTTEWGSHAVKHHLDTDDVNNRSIALLEQPDATAPPLRKPPIARDDPADRGPTPPQDTEGFVPASNGGHVNSMTPPVDSSTPPNLSVSSASMSLAKIYTKHGRIQGEFERLFDELRRDDLGSEMVEIKKAAVTSLKNMLLNEPK